MMQTPIAALVALLPGLASAHAQLESAAPPVGGTVAAAPAELQLTFSEGLEPRFCVVDVTGDGASLRSGTLHVDAGNARRLLVPVSRLAPGTYLVSWHAVSVDTHRTEGTYRFTVAP